MGGTGGCCSLVQAEQPGTRHLGRWDVKRKPVSSAKSRWWQYLTTASLQAVTPAAAEELWGGG